MRNLRALLRLTFFFLSPATVLVVFFAGFFSAAVLVALGGAIAVGAEGVLGEERAWNDGMSGMTLPGAPCRLLSFFLHFSRGRIRAI